MAHITINTGALKHYNINCTSLCAYEYIKQRLGKRALGYVSAKDIAKEINVTPQTVATIALKLKEAGLLYFDVVPKIGYRFSLR